MLCLNEPASLKMSTSTNTKWNHKIRWIAVENSYSSDQTVIWAPKFESVSVDIVSKSGLDKST